MYVALASNDIDPGSRRRLVVAGIDYVKSPLTEKMPAPREMRDQRSIRQDSDQELCDADLRVATTVTSDNYDQVAEIHII